MIITSDYVYINIQLDGTRNIVGNTLEEYERKSGFKYNRVIKRTIDRYNIIGEL